MVRFAPLRAPYDFPLVFTACDVTRIVSDVGCREGNDRTKASIRLQTLAFWQSLANQNRAVFHVVISCALSSNKL